MTMLPPPEVREELAVRAFALIAAYMRGDLEALDALVDDDDAGEMLVMATEISDRRLAEAGRCR
jgi:hypothetical protein